MGLERIERVPWRWVERGRGAAEGHLELLERAGVTARHRGQHIGRTPGEGGDQRGFPGGRDREVEQQEGQAERMRRRVRRCRDGGGLEDDRPIGERGLVQLARHAPSEHPQITARRAQRGERLGGNAVHAQLGERAGDG